MSIKVSEITRELIAVSRFFGVMEREAVCCGTVTVPQCVVLQTLLDADRDITGLAAQMGVNASTATRLVDGLERKGWVQRIRAEDDRRRVDVSLTDEGELEAHRLRGLSEAAVAAVFQRIPKDKRAMVLESLGLVRGALEEARDALQGCCG